jgi:hypothetical protein
MTNAIANRSGARSRPARAFLFAALVTPLGGCASFVEVPVETPLQSKLDVSAFRRVLIAGFVSDPGEADVDLSPETVRLLQNQLRSHTKMQILEPDRPPLQDALEKLRARFGDGERLSKTDREQFRLEAEKLLQDGEFWRRIGEEFQNPLIVTGKVGFETQNRSGFQTEERIVRGPDNRPRLIRGNRYLERKGFSLNADFVFVDGRTGQTLHKEKFTEEVLYGEDQKVSPLSSYFELMDRLLPNFLGVISPQKIRGTRVLLF